MKLQQHAEGLLEFGLPQQALNELSRLAEGDANEVQTLYLRGEALRTLERYSDAIVPLRKVSEIEPENTRVWLALGWCYKRIGRIDLAIEALEAALAADAEDPLIRYNLACYHCVAGDKPHALSYLEQSLSIDPNFRQLIDLEPDFDSLRKDPDFQAICEGPRTRG